jgi:amino acid adenylation domain-containing protein
MKDLKETNDNSVLQGDSSAEVEIRIAGLSPAKRALLQSRVKQIPVTAKNSPITPRAKRNPAPLSYNQELLWLVDQLAPGSVMYTVPRPWRVLGNLNIEALRLTLIRIIARHEVLRTTIQMVDGKPVQVIGENQMPELKVVDLSEYPKADRDAEAQQLLSQAIHRPFDLSRDLLLRATLLRLGDQEHILLLDSHHIASDGWSKAVLFKELNELYKAYCTGQVPCLPDLPIQYADFAIWQRESLKGEIIEKQLAYWKRQLDGAPALLEFPNARPRPAVPTYRGKGHREDFPKSLADSFNALSRQEGTTLFITLLSAFYTFLYRYTNQEDIVIGTPIAGRNRPEWEGLIGYFTNTLALRGDLSANPTFRQLLKRVRAVALGAYEHQDLPFEKLVLEMRPERTLSHSPIFQVMFSSGHYGTQVPELHGLTLSPLFVDRCTARFDLLVGMTECPDRLAVAWEFSTDLFEEATIIQMMRHFRTMMGAIVANPDQHLSEFPLLTPKEKEHILVDWNYTQADYPRDVCIHRLIEAQAERMPDAVAAVFQGRPLTYRELNVRANQLAHYLRGRGIGPEVMVGICMERSLELLVALLGILKAGGAYVPLDPAYPKERLRAMVRDARVPLLITLQWLKELVPVDGEVICLDTNWDRISRESSENPSIDITADDLAYVIYTSGSTGKPHGVLISHRGMVNHSLAAVKLYRLQPTTRVLQFSSISFDIAVEEIFPTLITGATVVLRSNDCDISGSHFLQWLKDEQITFLDLPTAYWHEWVRELSRQGEVLPESLRTLVVGGEKALASAYVAWQKIAADRVRWLNTYGPTEATVVATVYDPADAPTGQDNCSEIPIGRPIPNTEAYVLDAHLQPVPVGVSGELHIGGVGLARGYLNAPELTAEKFVPNPFSNQPGARLFRTGDLARWRPDGHLEYLGRIDHQVKIRGFRIELGEIEVVLSQHPGVSEAVALAREDQPGNKRLVAYIVPGSQPAVLTSELRAFIKQNLPEYMVPSAYVFLDQMPLTPNGKVDRRALPAPELETSSDRGAQIAPRNGYEMELVMIWDEVLGRKSLGVKDNFFELGGHSLSAVRMLALIEKTFGQKLPLVTLFQAPTIEELAVVLQKDRSDLAWPRLMPIKPSGSKPPLFAVAIPRANPLGYAFLARRLDNDQPLYVLQSQLLLEEETETYQGDLKDLAARYLKEVRLLQPEGPYYLIGQCQGAHIAFEMAVQLQEQNQRVAFLGILDTESIDTLSYLWYVRRLHTRSHYYWRRLGALLGAPFEEQRSLLSRKSKSIIARVGRMFSLNGQTDSRALARPAKFLKPSLALYRRRITLFRVQKQQYWRKRDLYKGWGKRTTGGVDVHILPGEHLIMFREPYVQILAENLTACMARAALDSGENNIPESDQVLDNPSSFRTPSNRKNLSESDRGLLSTVTSQSAK